MRPHAVRFTRSCKVSKRRRYWDALCSLIAPSISQLLMLYLYDLRDVRPFLNGSDLLALGVPVGPKWVNYSTTC